MCIRDRRRRCAQDTVHQLCSIGVHPFHRTLQGACRLREVYSPSGQRSRKRHHRAEVGDLRNGRRSTVKRMARGTVEPTLTEVTPGDLSFVLPYRHLQDIVDMLEALDALLPGLAARDTLLY